MDKNDLVLPVFACPRCNEREADALIVDDDDIVTCATCGNTYSVAPAVVAKVAKLLSDGLMATCDGVVMCADCPMLDTDDCALYQAHLTEAGHGDDMPAIWNIQTAEVAGAYSPRCDF